MPEGFNIPTCLVFSGHDPSGGAGVQADIEVLASMGCHAATVLTCLTVQDSHDVYAVQPMPASFLAEQARTILADMPVQAVKIGLVADAESAKAIHAVLTEHPDMPVVLDPIVRAGGGELLQATPARDAIRRLLFPLTSVLTPNSPEAHAFTESDEPPDICAAALLEHGCEFVLLSGGHGSGEFVINTLFCRNRVPEQFQWPRLPHEYHGSGCTLSAAIAGLLAHGHDVDSAVRRAQDYTWKALRQAYPTGRGQLQPQHFFWTDTAGWSK